MGGDVIRAPSLMHGKTCTHQPHRQGPVPRPQFRLRGDALPFADVKPETLPEALEVTATTDDGVIMGMQHKTLPLHGVQFHPESIASENGHALLQNFLNIARDFNLKKAA